MRGLFSRRKDLLLWIFAAAFLGLFTIFLFRGESLFLSGTGVQARLRARAARLREEPAEKAARAIGLEIKAFLDASKHASQVVVRIDEAGAERIVFTLTVPWTVGSAKLHRLRGETTARLAASLLKSAGAARVAVVVKLRRRRIRGGESDLVGQAVYAPGPGKVDWRAGGSP